MSTLTMADDWDAMLAHSPILVMAVGEDRRVRRVAGGNVSRHGGPPRFIGRPVGAVFAGSTRLTEALERLSPGEPAQFAAVFDDVHYAIWVHTHAAGASLIAVEQARAAVPLSQGGQAQRLQSLGRLAGGIAHDFNNVLMAIMGHAQLIERRSSDEGIRSAAATIVTAAERATGLTDQLSGFARQGQLRKEPAIVDELVAEVCRLLDRTLDRRIRLVHRGSATPAVVRGDPGQLQQVILNLALNARDAMADGGELVFATDIVQAEPTDHEVTSDLPTKTYVKLAVTDTGAGMSEDVRARVFEPYFTTKDVGEGHGLGLSLVYGIVRNHDGWIRVHSRPNEGSTFEVFLPLDRTTLLDTRPPTLEPTPGRGHVLVVDDEAMVRAAVRGLLERLGYRVTTADGGSEALALFERTPAAFDVVLMDLRMPGMGGPECLARMRATDPELRAVLSSGYLSPKAVQQALQGGHTTFLPKPYTIKRLAESIRAALDGG